MAYGYTNPYSRPYSWQNARNNGSDLLVDLNRQINRLFDDVFDFDRDDGESDSGRNRRRANPPAIDIAQTEDAYLVDVELPGVDPENIELTCEDNTLCLKAEKKRRVEDADSDWSERRYGRFERQIELPQDIDPEGIEAECCNGVVQLTIPRAEEEKNVRRIELKRGEQSGTTRLLEREDEQISENA